MLNEKTAAIIMICKNRFSEETRKTVGQYALDTIECIRWWIASYTGMPLIYSEERYVKEYLRDTVIDFVSNCEHPEAFIRKIFELIDKGYDERHAYISALRMVKVRDDHENYVNGFSEELIQPVSFTKGDS